jgi:NAD(P)-dependent dehydrogenase (short-subunit alcohol dehydrogenase family)
MDIQPQQIAVITGGGTGIGRALARQLSAAGVHLSLCDLSEEAMAETRRLCLDSAPAGTRVHCFGADVSREAEVLAFRDAVAAAHQSPYIHLLFNNAGIGGGGGFVNGSRADWERTFGVCWFGVYYNARAFVPMLVAGPGGCIVNISSVNGFWASLGSTSSHTAYSAAKFAVKGFTEALINDLRLNAPHVRCAVVMPGHIGTSIAMNSVGAAKLDAAQIAAIRLRMIRGGAAVAELPDDAIRQILHQRGLDFRDNAPTTADQAATVILDGVRAGQWRILVGDDAVLLDQMVRADPGAAYEASFAQFWADRKSLLGGTAPGALAAAPAPTHPPRETP